jgi:perosamine synthetase
MLTAQSPVPYWYTKLGKEEIAAAGAAIRSENLSMGPITRAFEEALSAYLGAPYVVLTTSGSVALYMAFKVLGIGTGDEVVVPNRTFIATAHAVMMTGAKVKLVDSRPDCTVVDENQIESAITKHTKAICPVHLNGNPADMRTIRAIAAKYGLFVVEDAAQAFGSRTSDGMLGTTGHLGCWSLGVTKLITTGQGGFLCTRDRQLHERLLLLRTHGVASTFSAHFGSFGFNFRYNDISASIGLVQLGKVATKIAKHVDVYRWYEREIADIPYLKLLPVDIQAGQLPLWVEVLCSERDKVVEILDARGIQVRPFLPDLSESPHLENDDTRFVNSKRFARHGMFLPVGPDLPFAAMERTVDALRALRREIAPLH